MSLYTLPNGTTSFDEILVDTITAVPGFTPMILVFVFFVVWLGGIARQKLRTGTSDYAMWCVVASLSTFMVTLIMTIIEGLIKIDWLVVVIVVNIFAGFWLFASRRASEI